MIKMEKVTTYSFNNQILLQHKEDGSNTVGGSFGPALDDKTLAALALCILTDLGIRLPSSILAERSSEAEAVRGELLYLCTAKDEASF